MPETLERYKTDPKCAVIPIPGSSGANGFGLNRVKANVERPSARIFCSTMRKRGLDPMAQQGRIVKVAGPLIVAENMADVRMYDVVRVSKNRLVGEVIELRGDKASIQVYEETSGLGPGEPVESTGAPLSVELGPGLIESISTAFSVR